MNTMVFINFWSVTKVMFRHCVIQAKLTSLAARSLSPIKVPYAQHVKGDGPKLMWSHPDTCYWTRKSSAYSTSLSLHAMHHLWRLVLTKNKTPRSKRVLLHNSGFAPRAPSKPDTHKGARLLIPRFPKAVLHYQILRRSNLMKGKRFLIGIR